MHFINPVEALQLHYSALETIDDGAIAEAKRKFAERIERQGETALQYHGRVYTKEQFEASFELLNIPNALSAFYRLYRYPNLNAVLAGDGVRTAIEYRAFSDEEMMAVLKPVLMEQWGSAWAEAVANQDVGAIMELRQNHIEKFNFPMDELMAKTDAYFLQKLKELDTFVVQVEAAPTAPIPEELRGAYWFRSHFGTEMMHVLPPRYHQLKEIFAKKVMRICGAVFEYQPAVAEGFLAYILTFLPDGETRNIAIAARIEISNYKESTPEYQANRQESGAKEAWKAIVFVITIIVLIIRVFILVNNNARLDNYQSQMAVKRQIEAAKQRSIEFEEERIMDSISRSEVGDVSRPHGLAPLKHCQTPKPGMKGGWRELTITGDKEYDAIVLLFDGSRNAGQIYVAARQQAMWQGFMERSIVSTMVVFGKGWNAKLINPCSEPGWFGGKIVYAGFGGNVTYPYPVELGHKEFELRRSQLPQNKELSEIDFFQAAHRGL
ncbi:MAG TPA: hypothetical protein PLL53_11680 [Saprospiraceae bacterium]|nr:hypothetical protein [Saprospiraceae bacterium]